MAHDAEVQSLNDQLNLERQEFKSKEEEATSKIRELEKVLESERQQAKVCAFSIYYSFDTHFFSKLSVDIRWLF